MRSTQVWIYPLAKEGLGREVVEIVEIESIGVVVVPRLAGLGSCWEIRLVGVDHARGGVST